MDRDAAAVGQPDRALHRSCTKRHLRRTRASCVDGGVCDVRGRDRAGSRRGRIPAAGARAGGGAMNELAPGEIVLDDAWRAFPARSDRARTLKELVTSLAGRRVAEELPPTQALAGVSLHVRPGETLGVIG